MAQTATVFRDRGTDVPAKKTALTDAERAKRIRETAREHETSNNPKDFERAFGEIARSRKVGRDNPDDPAMESSNRPFRKPR
jgi:hypothetical protein